MKKNIPGALGIGVDIVEMKRIKKIKSLSQFAGYFLTPKEMRFFKKRADPLSFIASRFAAKEAVIKAFPGFLKPHDFEIDKKDKKPIVVFLNKKYQKKYNVLVSISHSIDYAAAYAAIFKKNQRAL